MSAHHERSSPSTAGSFNTAPNEILSSPFALYTSPSHESQHRSGGWSSPDLARLLLTEHFPQCLPNEAPSEQRRHLLHNSSEPAGDVSSTQLPGPTSSPLSSWTSQSSLPLQLSLSSVSDGSGLLNASPSYDSLPTPFEQYQVHQQPLQFSQNDLDGTAEDSSWERQLAACLFGNYPCPPCSEVAPSSVLPTAALYADANAATDSPMPLVAAEDRRLAQAAAMYAPFSAIHGLPSPQFYSEAYRPTSPSLGLGSWLGPPPVAAVAVEPPKRTSVACRFCKARKLRCDGCHPCRQCQRRSVECLYQPEAQARPSRRMTNPCNASFAALRPTTAPATSEDQHSSQRSYPRKRSCTTVAETGAAARPYTSQTPASSSAHSWWPYSSTAHSAHGSTASCSVPTTVGGSTAGARRHDGRSSHETTKEENQSSPGPSSAARSSLRTASPTQAGQSSSSSSSKGGQKSIFTTINIRSRRPQRNGSEASAVHEVRYVCPFPGCHSHFSTSGHARRHNRIHAVLEPFACPHRGCDKTFTRRDNCTQHQRARHAFQLVAYRVTAKRSNSKGMG